LNSSHWSENEESISVAVCGTDILNYCPKLNRPGKKVVSNHGFECRKYFFPCIPMVPYSVEFRGSVNKKHTYTKKKKGNRTPLGKR
jgi:hypothetical protein